MAHAGGAAASASSGLSWTGRFFFGSLSGGTFGLGIWQTQRYFEKRDLVSQRHAALELTPLAHFSFDSQPYRRMQLHGRFLYDKECLVGPRGPPLGALPNKPGYASGGMARAPMGYFVLTPLVLNNGDGSSGGGGGGGDGTTQNNNEDLFVVWVNRGWVPQFMVETTTYDNNNNQDRRGPSTSSRSNQQQQKRQRPIIAWERPKEKISSNSDNNNLSSVTVVSSTPEKPKFLVADHNLTSDPPKLFWFDLDTLRRTIMGDMGGSNNSDKNNNYDTNEPSCHVLSLVTAVRDDSVKDDGDKFVFPLMPPARNVGDFKTSPSIHAGYAATWYGLSMAGFYMTRKLILRR